MKRFLFGAAVGAGLVYAYLNYYSTDVPDWMRGTAKGYTDSSMREQIKKDGLDR